jgi:diacylglycerol kinase family enzyme
MDAAIMRDAPEAAKARIGWPAYLVSAARQLRGHGDRMHLELDGGAPRGRYAKTILVGNMGTLQAGLELMPDAEPDDGVLDVAVLSPRWAADWVRIAARVIARRRRTDQRFASLRAKQIRVTTRLVQPRQVDGDLLESARELRIEVEPAALRVHTPPTPPAPPRGRERA